MNIIDSLLNRGLISRQNSMSPRTQYQEGGIVEEHEDEDLREGSRPASTADINQFYRDYKKAAAEGPTRMPMFFGGGSEGLQEYYQATQPWRRAKNKDIPFLGYSYEDKQMMVLYNMLNQGTYRSTMAEGPKRGWQGYVSSSSQERYDNLLDMILGFQEEEEEEVIS